MFDLRPHQQTVIDTLQENRKGQIIVPTGGGKTICMIEDAKYQFTMNNVSKTIVVVAPRILLAQQLCEDFDENILTNPMLQYQILHVHSGDTHHESTTDSDTISKWTKDNYRYNKLIFTTYHSLHRIQEAEILSLIHI